MRQSLLAVADHRGTRLSGLEETFDGYAEIGQPRWASWRAKSQLIDTLPAAFSEVLDALRAFADPILIGSAAGSATWNPARRKWETGQGS